MSVVSVKLNQTVWVCVGDDWDQIFAAEYDIGSSVVMMGARKIDGTRFFATYASDLDGPIVGNGFKDLWFFGKIRVECYLIYTDDVT